MGCNRSNTFSPIVPRSKNNSEDLRPIQKGSFVSQKYGPISNFYDLKSVLGSHQNYSIYFATEKNSKSCFSVKEVSKSSNSDSILVHKEVRVLTKLDHPNILKIFEIIESPRSFYIVYEYITGESLKDNLKKICDEVGVCRYMNDILSALNYIHKLGYIHCDLNIDNIVLSNLENKVCKISGFSFARHKDDLNLTDLNKINPLYASPELILSGKLSTQTDVWSMGIVLYTLLVGRLPYTGRTLNEILNEIITNKLDLSNTTYLSLSVAVRDLISKMLEFNPDTRITIESALRHNWLVEGRQNITINFNTLNRLKTFKVKSNLVRCFLTYYSFKANLEDNEVVKCFKEIDMNFDGTVSKTELVETFKKSGIDISEDINDIMKNIDIDQSGAIDYAELKVVLADWEKEIKKKNLAKVLNVKDSFVDLSELITDLPQVLPSEWKKFCGAVKVQENLVHVGEIKKYILSHMKL